MNTDITKTACIVAITMGLPRQSRELKAAAAEVEETHNSQRGTTKVNMFYFRRTEGSKVLDGLATLKKFQGEWRRSLEHYARYPYAGGMRLLPAALVSKFWDINEDFKSKQADVWSKWAEDEYPQWRTSAPERMGDLFTSEDFPKLSECMDRFSCDCTITPLSSGKQWQYISEIGGDLTSALAAQTDEKIQAAVKEAQASMWEDVLKPIQNVVTVLSKDKSKISSTLISNVIDIVDIVPASVLNEDPNLIELAKQAKEVLGSITPDDLRKSDELKKATAVKVNGLLTAFKPFARKLSV